MLRPFWSRIFASAWPYSIVLLVVIAAMRAYATLGPPKAAPLFLCQFLIMWLLPFVLLTRDGRQEIGICAASRPAWLLWGPLLGAAAAGAFVAIGFGLYGFGSDNWVITIRDTYRQVASPMGKWPTFAVLAFGSGIVSPIGEEFFFRGVFHFSIKRAAGGSRATLANALAFGSVHLVHHGIWKDAAGLHLRLGSGLMMVLLTTGLGWLLTICRLRSGSLWPAVLAHSASTLFVNLTVFCFLI